LTEAAHNPRMTEANDTKSPVRKLP
jgi:hypothetical protein